MVINGNNIAEEIKDLLREKIVARGKSPVLSIVSAGEEPATRKFIAVKKRFADNVGIPVHEHNYGVSVHTEELINCIAEHAGESDGIIVQLPLLASVEVQGVLDAIPEQHDVDVLSTTAFEKFKAGMFPVLPPVVAAMEEILIRSDVVPQGKKAVVIGAGRLVGAPAALWLRNQGASVDVVDETTQDIPSRIRTADIIVSGAGSPGMVTPDMVREGVVILDAGTSEAEGKLAGDVAPECALKARVFTPVPGGIGPITVAKVFENLLTLTSQDS